MIGVSRQRRADRADAAVHHVARRDDVGAGLGVADRGAREQLERRVVRPPRRRAARRSGRGRVLAEADVGDRRSSGTPPERAHRPLDDRRRRPRRRSRPRPSPPGCRRAAPPARRARRARSASRTISSTTLGDRRRAPRPVDDALARAREQRHHEPSSDERRLAHERAQRVGAAQAPQAGDGKELIATKGTPATRAYRQRR